MLKFKRIVCFISVFLIVVTAVGCQNKTVGNAIKHFSFGEVPDVMKNSTPCLGTQLMTKAAESDAYTLYVNEATLQLKAKTAEGYGIPLRLIIQTIPAKPTTPCARFIYSLRIQTEQNVTIIPTPMEF